MWVLTLSTIKALLQDPRLELGSGIDIYSSGSLTIKRLDNKAHAKVQAENIKAVALALGLIFSETEKEFTIKIPETQKESTAFLEGIIKKAKDFNFSKFKDAPNKANNNKETDKQKISTATTSQSSAIQSSATQSSGKDFSMPISWSYGVAPPQGIVIIEERMKMTVYPEVVEIRAALSNLGMKTIQEPTHQFRDIVFIPEDQLNKIKFGLKEIQTVFPEMSKTYLLETIFAKAFRLRAGDTILSGELNGIKGLRLHIRDQNKSRTNDGSFLKMDVERAFERVFFLVAFRKIMEVSDFLRLGLQAALDVDRLRKADLIADRSVGLDIDRGDFEKHPIFIAAKRMGIRAEFFHSEWSSNLWIGLFFPKDTLWEENSSQNRSKAIKTYTEIIKKVDLYLKELKTPATAPTAAQTAAPIAAQTAAPTAKTPATVSAPILLSQSNSKDNTKYTPINEWTDQELAQWIVKINSEYSQYSDKIVSAGFDGSKALDPKALAEVITNEMHCKNILEKLNEYHAKCSGKAKVSNK